MAAAKRLRERGELEALHHHRRGGCFFFFVLVVFLGVSFGCFAVCLCIFLILFCFCWFLFHTWDFVGFGLIAERFGFLFLVPICFGL